MQAANNWNRRLMIAVLAIAAVQTGLRLFALTPLQPRILLHGTIAHGLDLMLLAGLAMVALRLSVTRAWLRLVLAFSLAVVAAVLLAFDLSLAAALPSGQRPMTLATVHTLTCGLGGTLACMREFPLTGLALATGFLALAALLYWVVGQLGPTSHSLLRRRWVRAVVVLMIGVPLMAWVLRPASMISYEPLYRFLLKSEFLAQPAELVTIPRADFRIAPSPGAAPRPLVLVVVDSLRADAVELRAGQPSRTPFLQSLAASGRLHDFGPAVALCATSYCGITGILGSSDWDALRKGPPLTLADVLAANGYQSHYLLTGPHRRAFNMAALYGPHVDTMLDDSSADSQGLVDDRDQLRRLRTLPIKDPTRSFIFVHLMSAHGAGLRFDRQDEPATLLSRLVPAGAAPGGYQAFYERGVSQADGVLRELFAVLRQRGLGDALVIITADHGERLSGAIGHGAAVDLDTALVPMLVYDPRETSWPRASGGVTSTIDAAPTLLAAARIDLPGQWRGAPLQAPIVRSSAASDSATQTAQISRSGTDWVMTLCIRAKPNAPCKRMVSDLSPVLPKAAGR